MLAYTVYKLIQLCDGSIALDGNDKVGGNAWERRSQPRHFCNLSLPGLKELFSVRTHVPRPER